MIRGLDDDEVDFLEVIDKAKMDAERKQQLEEKHEMQDFRQKVATLQEQNLDKVSLSFIMNDRRTSHNIFIFFKQKIQSEVSQTKITKTNSRLSQKAILSGVIKKRKLSESNENGQSEKKSNEIEELPPKQVKVDNDVSTSGEENTSVGALKCIGILPGIGGTYESSDSEKSTDTDDDYDYSKYDWVGRKKGLSGAYGGCGQ